MYEYREECIEDREKKIAFGLFGQRQRKQMQSEEKQIHMHSNTER